MLSSFNEYSIGAMTPNALNQIVEPSPKIQRKSSKASITRSDDQSIPSPPLSPYHTAETLSTTTSANPSDFECSKSEDPIETIVVLRSSFAVDNNSKEFPSSNFENLSMSLNAWSNVNSKSYKRQQLSFLKHYLNGHAKSKTAGNVSKLPTRRYAPRRVSSRINSESANYNSESDYPSSSLEKIRTRRLVRESTHAPESDSSSKIISLPALPTPVKKRKAATSTPSAQHVSVDWESVPDYCPDTSTLPNNSRCLKVEWKGQPMSLANDPLLDKLHPAEVTLASILRLPCNLYLDSKRRLFAEKVARLRKGLPFRRTDAQKSCRIDVNKASRLFAAFEKIGWLKDDKFAKFL